MAAVKDARGNISPKLADSKHPTLKVVKQAQSLAEAEPAAEEAVAEPAGAEQVAPEAQAEEATSEEGTPETPPLSAQMFPADAGPGVMQESEDPRVAGPPVGYAPMAEGEAPPQAGATAPVMANGMVEQPMSAQAAAGQSAPAQIEETMMPQPGLVPQAQVNLQDVYRYGIYWGTFRRFININVIDPYPIHINTNIKNLPGTPRRPRDSTGKCKNRT